MSPGSERAVAGDAVHDLARSTETRRSCGGSPRTSWKFGFAPRAADDAARPRHRARAVVTPGAISAARRVERRGRDAARARPSRGARRASCRSSGGTPRVRPRRRRRPARARAPRAPRRCASVTSSSVPTPSISHDDAAVAVDVEDRRRLALVDRQAVRDDLLGVVGAALLHARAAQPRDALLARHRELDHGVERLAAAGEERVEVADLGEVARVAVEQEAVRGIRLREAVAHELAGQLVGDEVARLDDRLAPACRARCRPRCSRGRCRRSRSAGMPNASAIRHALGSLAGALRADDQEAGGAAAAAVIGAVLRSVAAAAGRRSASPSRGRRRR